MDLHRAIAGLSLCILMSSAMPAEISKPSSVVEELESFMDLDTSDEDAVRMAVAQIYLQCAALQYSMSTSIASSRPSLSKLHQERGNFFKLVGMAELTQPDEILADKQTVVNAYIETYLLNTLSEFSDKDLEVKLKRCESESLQSHGKEVIESLEPQLDLGP